MNGRTFIQQFIESKITPDERKDYYAVLDPSKLNNYYYYLTYNELYDEVEIYRKNEYKADLDDDNYNIGNYFHTEQKAREIRYMLANKYNWKNKDIYWC